MSRAWLQKLIVYITIIVIIPSSGLLALIVDDGDVFITKTTNAGEVLYLLESAASLPAKVL